MADGIYAALSGAISQGTSLETTAENLANASTDGYQRLRPMFRAVLAAATKNGQGPQQFAGLSGTANDTTAGALRETKRPLDMAMPAGTYLAVSTPRGERYTRAGALSLSVDGTLAANAGAPVLGEDGKPIKLPAGTEGSLSADGSVMANGEVVAHLRLVSFEDASALAHEGGTFLATNAAAGDPTISKEPIVVGMLEESNAQVVSAMNDLVSATRQFEAFQRAIDAFRDADRKVVTQVPSTQ